MKLIDVKDFCFSFTNGKNILNHLSFSLEEGEMLLLCGENGCGKSTLLRCLKKEVAPKGNTSGIIQCAAQSAILFQESDKNIIFRDAYEDLIFPACNYGIPEEEIEKRAGEILRSFGLEAIKNRNTGTLSGGEKQLLSLASLMMLRPALLLLDEPLAQLDEKAKDIFTDRLLELKQNGTAIIIAEHNTDRLLEKSDQILVFGEKEQHLYKKKSFADIPFLPNAPEYLHLEKKLSLPVKDFSAAEATQNIKDALPRLTIHQQVREHKSDKEVLRLEDIAFQFTKSAALLEKINFSLHQGEVAFLSGKNGAGKTTLLSIICSFLKPLHGRCTIASSHSLGYLAQNPVYSFLKDTLEADFRFVLKKNKLPESRMEECFEQYPLFAPLIPLLSQNPLDLSGGERAKAAIFKLLMLERDILLLDEPEKHLDKRSMRELSVIIQALSAQGISFLIVSHSPDFIYTTAHTVYALEDGMLHAFSLQTFFPHHCKTSLYRSLNGCGNIMVCSEAEVRNG